MKVKIPEALFTQSGGIAAWKRYGLNPDPYKWQRYTEIDLSELPQQRLPLLRELVEKHRDVKGSVLLLRDIDTWMRAAGGDGADAKARTVEQFGTLLTRYLGGVPDHWLYERGATSGEWSAYYVEKVTYHPPTDTAHGGKIPPRVSIDLFWTEFGTRHERVVSFHAEQCLHLPVHEVLMSAGFVAQTDELRTEYERDAEKFRGLVDKVGLQLFAVGKGTTNLDGNEDSSWRWSTILLDHGDVPARVVVDVFRETDKEERDREAYIDLWFWKNRKRARTVDDDGEWEDDDTVADSTKGKHWRETREPLPVEDAEERPRVEVPLHPMLAVFDMRRHMRLRVHVACCEVYTYDTRLAEKLVLPADTISLVEMLVSNTSAFCDIVAGKSGGSIILCAGPAGVGKTLTAEVYSEAKERPLYSVQCSQLGINPESLEKELHVIFARAQRWNAILLLDEADVYVMKRGTDLTQNAIVGVFLRVLEYYSGVLFLTTNRGDSVDDAIASRCVARIDYTNPPLADQRRLWLVLSKTSGVNIDAATIEEVLTRHNNLSGRDIKNLIKLANLVCASKRIRVTASVIDFVKRFKPTSDNAPAPDVQPITLPVAVPVRRKRGR